MKAYRHSYANVSMTIVAMECALRIVGKHRSLTLISYIAKRDNKSACKPVFFLPNASDTHNRLMLTTGMVLMHAGVAGSQAAGSRGSGSFRDRDQVLNCEFESAPTAILGHPHHNKPCTQHHRSDGNRFSEAAGLSRTPIGRQRSWS